MDSRKEGLSGRRRRQLRAYAWGLRGVRLVALPYRGRQVCSMITFIPEASFGALCIRNSVLNSHQRCCSRVKPLILMLSVLHETRTRHTIASGHTLCTRSPEQQKQNKRANTLLTDYGQGSQL